MHYILLTTAVNMGKKKGICSRIKVWFNVTVGHVHDVHVFECLLHINELYLTHFIKLTEGTIRYHLISCFMFNVHRSYII